jgi:hypothetical protein
MRVLVLSREMPAEPRSSASNLELSLRSKLRRRHPRALRQTRTLVHPKIKTETIRHLSAASLIETNPS